MALVLTLAVAAAVRIGRRAVVVGAMLLLTDAVFLVPNAVVNLARSYLQSEVRSIDALPTQYDIAITSIVVMSLSGPYCVNVRQQAA